MSGKTMSASSVSVTEAKRGWSKLLARVERGETIEITRRGKSAGWFVPAYAPTDDTREKAPAQQTSPRTKESR